MSPDIVPPAVRSRMMAGIRGKNTKPELQLRSGLHRRGLRFRLHCNSLPGRPDLVFPKYKAVIFAHGCFWHGHDCHLFRLPTTRAEFWRAKIHSNVERDRDQTNALLQAGWRVSVVWECALKGRTRLPFDETISQCENWILSNEPGIEIRGNQERSSG